MLDKYTKELESLYEWYLRAKELAIDVEGFDTKVYIQPMHELRYSYDHLMRAAMYEMNPETNDADKIRKAIASAEGHLLRAYSDCVEWLLVTVRSEYDRILQPQKQVFTTEEINSVFPEYYNSIRDELEQISEAVNQYKKHKRVENNGNLEDADGFFSGDFIKGLCDSATGFFDHKYTEKLREYLTKIHKVEKQFAIIKRRRTINYLLKSVLVPVATSVVGAVIAGLIVFYITKG